MTRVENLIAPFKNEARLCLSQGRVKEVEFSRGTYQVQIVDEVSEEEYWPFIQFGDGADVKDCFCSCSTAEEKATCEHLAAALMRIYNGHADPLHLRFQRSLWNQLCLLNSQRLGHETEILIRKEAGHYICDSVTGKQVFTMEAKGAAAILRLEAITDRRVQETEETSLKFSGIPLEEITLWRQGRPPLELRYELSFWADLAKWMMFLQESGESYALQFGYSKQGLPNEVNVRFKQIEASFYLSEANLPSVIPSLATVKSPLKIYHFQEEAIDKIVYDKLTGVMRVFATQDRLDTLGQKELSLPRAAEGAQELDDWYFVPGDGFYSKEQHTLLLTPIIHLETLADVLRAHAKTISAHLVDDKVHMNPLKMAYTIFFDDSWSLHIDCYLFSPGDLQTPYARYFRDWAYIEDDGFYPIEDALFDEVEKIVPLDEVSSFVHRYRYWLNTQDTFHTHLSTVEAHLRYQLSEEDELAFESSFDLLEDALDTKDMGEWIYVVGQGFYLKEKTKGIVSLSGGTVVKKEEIPFFIRLHREELENVESFFASQCPVAQMALKVSVSGKDQITISPEYLVHSAYRKAPLRVFEEFVYLEEEGFSEIPLALRVPERFRNTVSLKGQELELFITYEMDALKHTISSIDPRLQRPTALKLMVHDAVKGSGIHDGLLELNLTYESDVGSLSVADLLRELKRSKRYYFSGAGLLDLQETRFQWLRQLPASRTEKLQHHIKLTPLEMIRLNAVEELQCPMDSPAYKLLHSFESLTPPSSPDLTGLQSSLRPYQEVGVNWLWFLYSYYLSGLLCDDMGLGKTHQAMALLAAVANAHRDLPQEEKPQYLVTCPTSVIYHWKEKLARFLPDFKIYVFYGAQRSLENLEAYDLILTSYGVLRSEKEALSQVYFEVAIFDEVQIAKNHNSQTYAALNALHAKMRLGLTGTPIENYLRELKALFDIVLPYYMPSDAQFRDNYTIPIEKQKNEERKLHLRKIVSPFVMRRKKEDVLKDLPEKNEEKARCELSEEQHRLYKEVLGRSKENLIRELQDESKPIPYMHVFAVLSTLKQICDHPAVYLKDPHSYKEHRSGKWDLFIELLSQARESSQKVVVFSQYLDMLDVIELYLKETDIGFAAIRGKTVKREEELRRFEQDPRCEVFVGSLQAVGLGVDLTAGSVVIHYDRWWNAARENQATDRVHRIGQTRGVQVFKLITFNTLEEQIDLLIEKKGALMEDVIGIDDHSQLKGFNREDLLTLLQTSQ